MCVIGSLHFFQGVVVSPKSNGGLTEHRLFSYISKNWAGQPLIDVQTVVSLIANTTTKAGLKVVCHPDNNVYFRGAVITDEEYDKILLEPVGEFGNWNYIIRGFQSNN